MSPSLLSIVIPARDEEAFIAPVIERALEVVAGGQPRPPHPDPLPRRGGEGGALEVIVVDGGSRDRTAAVAAAHGARVIEAAPGRGGQMNAGAAASSGEVLLFLHADTLLPRGYGEIVRNVLAREGVVAGAFRLSIDSPRRAFRLIEAAVAWRSGVLQMPYGDQAIFVAAETFRRAGGFARIPLMEDYDLMRRLRRLGRVALAPAAVTTSARRWRARGIWRTTILNQACIVGFRLGVGTERLARWRRG